jgi:hypothetical protein
MSKLAEFYGHTTHLKADWSSLAEAQICPYLGKRCIKVRKSQPDETIGSCSVYYSKYPLPIVICPLRLLEQSQVFMDCIHLLTLHEPGNELHIVSEVGIPGGNVDYILISARNQKVIDFIGIELQSLDTTGTVWPERQLFLSEQGLKLELSSPKNFGMNWKMTAKTILIQLHHKVETFESINKHLVLVIQDYFLDYIKRQFKFDRLNSPRIGDPMHIHSYSLSQSEDLSFRLRFKDRFSTDSIGIAHALGLQANPKVELQEIIRLLETKISNSTIFSPLIPK